MSAKVALACPAPTSATRGDRGYRITPCGLVVTRPLGADEWLALGRAKTIRAADLFCGAGGTSTWL